MMFHDYTCVSLPANFVFFAQYSIIHENCVCFEVTYFMGNLSISFPLFICLLIADTCH